VRSGSDARESRFLPFGTGQNGSVNRWQYVVLMAACLFVTLPLEFVFDARVWRRPRRLVLALTPAFAIFLVWDLWATATGTWSFDERYTLGIEVPGGMVVEELLFFTVVPICTLLTLESVRNILGRSHASSAVESAAVESAAVESAKRS
jgi:lycopene cyclase domain-containing protein